MSIYSYFYKARTVSNKIHKKRMAVRTAIPELLTKTKIYYLMLLRVTIKYPAMKNTAAKLKLE